MSGRLVLVLLFVPLLAAADDLASSDRLSYRMSGGVTEYLARRGDSLSAIGARFGVDAATLAADNGVANAHRVQHQPALPDRQPAHRPCPCGKRDGRHQRATTHAVLSADGWSLGGLSGSRRTFHLADAVCAVHHRYEREGPDVGCAAIGSSHPAKVLPVQLGPTADRARVPTIDEAWSLRARRWKTTTMSSRTNDSAPRPGDIVVHKRHSSENAYALSAFQRESQLTYQTYDDAIRQATAFGLMDRVDVWYTEDGQTYLSVARHRQRRRR